MNLTALPHIWAWPLRYNPLFWQRRVWLIERWWWQQGHLEVARLLQAGAGHKHLDSELGHIGEIAMQALARTSLASAQQQLREAKFRQRRPSTVRLKTVQMAQTPEPNWERRSGESWDAYKTRVFSPLHDFTFGLNAGFLSRYTETRLPPIANASAELQRRVGDTVRDSIEQQWSDRVTREKLQQAGGWAEARVRTQIRTETSTMFNAGRFAEFHKDEAVVGYRYLVTQDDRTTDICLALVDKTVKEGDIQDCPPLHFRCRTVLEPIFDFDKGVRWDDPTGLPSPGEGKYAQYAGFGQHELLAELRRT